MGVIIGSARIDERGKAYGGSAGDQRQTASPDYKGEVSMQSFYVHSKGWYVLRPKSEDHAKKIAAAMRTACNNPNIGYDQSGRYGVVKYGTDTKTKTEADCSSLVRACIKEATGKDVGDFYTANEASVLEKSGLFEKRMKYNSGVALFAGDVLVTCTQGHTVIVVSGESVAHSTTSLSKQVKWKGKVTATELNVRSWAGVEYSTCTFSPLKKGEYISVCDSMKASNGSDWYYIKKGAKYGFVSAKYIAKA